MTSKKIAQIMAVLLASESAYKERTPAAEGIQDKQVYPALLLAQEQDVMPVLGMELYNELIAQVEAETETAANLALLRKIEPFLVWAAHLNLRRWLWAKTVTAGVVNTQSPQQQAVGSTTLQWHDNKIAATAAQYRNDLVEFLNDNSHDYPLYKCTQKNNFNPWVKSMGGRSLPFS